MEYVGACGAATALEHGWRRGGSDTAAQQREHARNKRRRYVCAGNVLSFPSSRLTLMPLAANVQGARGVRGGGGRVSRLSRSYRQDELASLRQSED